MEHNRTLEQKYMKVKDAITALQGHMKAFRSDLNSIARQLLDGGGEYVFSTGELVLKQPTTHKATKIKN